VEEQSVTESIQASLYETIGGEPALTAVVDDFYDRVLRDEQLAGFFAGANMTRLKGRQVEFFAQALGGPHLYTGPSMRQAHQGRGIGYYQFNLVAGHLVDALAQAGVADVHINQIVAAISPLAEEIVTLR
jgi:hemoglobin